MAHPLRSASWIALALAAVLPAQADEARQRLVAERLALQQRFAVEERACADRFAVTACIDEVRARQRAALAPLREQELRFDEVERRRRADERRAAVAQKQADVARRPLPPAAPELRLREPVGVESATRAASAPAVVEPPRRAASPPGREAAEAARQARGLQQARERTEAAEARIRERRARQKEALAAKGRQPDSLPKPGKAESAASR